MGAISCLRHGRTPAEMIARDLAWENDETRRELIADHTDNEFCNRVWECWDRS